MSKVPLVFVIAVSLIACIAVWACEGQANSEPSQIVAWRALQATIMIALIGLWTGYCYWRADCQHRKEQTLRARQSATFDFIERLEDGVLEKVHEMMAAHNWPPTVEDIVADDSMLRDVRAGLNMVEGVYARVRAGDIDEVIACERLGMMLVEFVSNLKLFLDDVRRRYMRGAWTGATRLAQYWGTKEPCSLVSGKPLVLPESLPPKS